MRLLDGGSLAGRLPRYVDDPPAAAALVLTLARAIHHAHRRGVLHRDLKPSNVLYDGDGGAQVVDFGLAKRPGAVDDWTVSGMIVGTPAYMSPEQAEGRRGAVTVQSDVYGLGAILYATLTGRAPVDGDSLSDVLLRVREQPPAPPRVLNRRVDRDLEAICLKCLEKDPRHRYDTAEDLADDLARHLANEPIRARRYGPLQRALFWARSPRRVSQAGAFAVVLGTTLLVWASSGFALIGADLLVVERPRDLAWHLARCILGIYIPLIAIGTSTLRRRAWSLWGGAGLAIFCLVCLVGHILGYFPFDTGGLIDNGSPAMRVGGDALMIVLAVMLLLSYSFALFSRYSARSSSTLSHPRAGPAAGDDGGAGPVGLGRSDGPG
jgi:serine/threonine-protein kinase